MARGIDQMRHEVTATAEYKFRRRLSVRAEFRRDWSNQRFFTGPRPVSPARDGTPRSSVPCGGSVTRRVRGSARRRAIDILTETTMLDLMFVGLTVLFFLVGAAYVAGCGALNQGDTR